MAGEAENIAGETPVSVPSGQRPRLPPGDPTPRKAYTSSPATSLGGNGKKTTPGGKALLRVAPVKTLGIQKVGKAVVAITGAVNMTNLASMKSGTGDGGKGQRSPKTHPHVDCGLEYRTWHGANKDFVSRTVEPESADEFLSGLTTEMEDRIHSLTTPVGEDARARWLHMPGVNHGLLRVLQKHLYLAPKVVEDTCAVVANGEIDVTWFTEEELSGPPTEHFEHLFVLAHYIQETAVAARTSADSARGFDFRQVSFIYYPDFNLILSIDSTALKSWDKTKALAKNRLTLVRKSNEAAMILSAMIDEMVDEVYPLLANYGDSLEGLEFLIVNTKVTDDHVLLSFTLKRRIQSLRRYAWDMRQLLQELRQNQYGVLPKEALNLCKTIETNADSMVAIVEAYMLQCEGVESFYERQQEKVVASTLYMLTIVSVIIMPIQLLTGVFGMNFQPNSEGEGGMAELEWEYGYPMFFALCLVMITTIVCCLYKGGLLSGASLLGSWTNNADFEHPSDEDLQQRNGPRTASADDVCYYCKGSGHWKNNCPQKLAGLPPST